MTMGEAASSWRGRLARTRVISWAPSGWLRTRTYQGTDLLTLGCADDFFAIRVGFANMTPTPYPVRKVVACPSSTWSDYFNPTGGRQWVPFSFVNGGADTAKIVTAPDGPRSILVAGNATDVTSGETTVPRWTWSDWLPLASLPREDVRNGVRVVMLRGLFAGTQTVANGGFQEYRGDAALHLGFDYAVGGYPPDRVDDPQPGDVIAPAALRNLATGSAFSCVQFLTRNAGIVGMTTGDSHHMGTSTTTSFMNYLLRSTLSLAARDVGRLPFGYVSTAVGGTASQQFFAYLQTLLPVVRPSFVVLPGWTANEQHGDVHADQAAVDIFFARLLLAAEACQAVGALPIFLTPFPRNAERMTMTQLGPWLALRQAILSMSDAVVLDATPILGNRGPTGAFDGTYLPGMSTDAVHPDDAGHAAIAAALTAMLLPMIGSGSDAASDGARWRG